MALESLNPLDLESTGGHAAITPKMPTGPLAITKVIRGPDGNLQTIYVDARTGQELASLNGYTIWNSQNYLDPDFEDDEEKSPAKEVIKEKEEEPREIGRGGRDTSGIDTPGLGGRGIADFSFGRDDSPRSSKPKGDALNNYGYIDKPKGMGFANMLPGPLGMAAKIANTAINMNNVSAVNEARKSLGLKDQGFLGRVGGTLKDKHGQVANVTLGKENYSVGFEAQSPKGRTNLTPTEARQRMNQLAANEMKREVDEPEETETDEDFSVPEAEENVQAPANSIKEAMDRVMKETPKNEVKTDEKNFKKEMDDLGQETGFLSSVKNTISSIFDAVNPFDDDDEVSTDYFPDAPKQTSRTSAASERGERSYDGKSYSGQNAGHDTPSERSGVGRGSQMRGGETGASTSEANRGGRGVTAGGTGLW